MGRTPTCDLAGPAGSDYEIPTLQEEQEIARETGSFGPEEFAKSQLAAPAPGNYRLEFRVDGQTIGRRTFEVVPTFPTSFSELRADWIADRMPVIEGFLTRRSE